MLQKTNGIVLRLLPFNDKNKIVKIYTEHFGLQSFIVSAGSSKTSRQKLALLQALQPIALETSFRENGKLTRLGEINSLINMNNSMVHEVKRSVVIFLNELLYKCLREEQDDLPLFNFVLSSLKLLNESAENCNNFHIVFLLKLTRFLGFHPVNNHSNFHLYFYYNEGVFDNFKSDYNRMDEEQSKLFSMLLSIDYENMNEIKLNTTTRNKIVQSILTYYALHVPACKDFKSIDVLAEVHAV